MVLMALRALKSLRVVEHFVAQKYDRIVSTSVLGEASWWGLWLEVWPCWWSGVILKRVDNQLQSS
jgi:hypothetical protein